MKLSYTERPLKAPLEFFWLSLRALIVPTMDKFTIIISERKNIKSTL